MRMFTLFHRLRAAKNTAAEFKRPMGPHGLPYRVGNLGGKAVLLGEDAIFLEYEDSPVLKPEHRYKGYKAPRGILIR